MKQIEKLFAENKKTASKDKPLADVNYLYSQLYVGKITLKEYLEAIK